MEDFARKIKSLKCRHPGAKTFKDFIDSGDKYAEHLAGKDGKNLDYWELALKTYNIHGHQAKVLISPVLTKCDSLFKCATMVKRCSGLFSVYGCSRGKFAPSRYDGGHKIHYNKFNGMPGVMVTGNLRFIKVELSESALNCLDSYFGKTWRRCRPSFDAITRECGETLITVNLDIHERETFRIKRWFAIVKDGSTLLDIADKETIDFIKSMDKQKKQVYKNLDKLLEVGNWKQRHMKLDDRITVEGVSPFTYSRYYDDLTGEYVVIHDSKIIGRSGNVRTCYDIAKRHSYETL